MIFAWFYKISLPSLIQDTNRDGIKIIVNV